MIDKSNIAKLRSGAISDSIPLTNGEPMPHILCSALAAVFFLFACTPCTAGEDEEKLAAVKKHIDESCKQLSKTRI